MPKPFAKTHRNLTVRVFLENELGGRDYFDDYDNIDDCLRAVRALARNTLKMNDGITRRIGLEIAVDESINQGE